MEKTLKIVDCIGFFSILKDAKLGKLSDEEKFRVFRLMRKLKVIASAYSDAQNDALNSFKGEDHDVIIEDYRTWINEEKEGKEISISELRRKQIIDYLNGYNSNVELAINDELNKEQKIEFEGLPEESVDKLAAANDWTFSQLQVVLDIYK